MSDPPGFFVFKHKVLNPNSRVSDSGVWGEYREPAFLKSSRVMLMLLVSRLDLKRHCPQMLSPFSLTQRKEKMEIEEDMTQKLHIFFSAQILLGRTQLKRSKNAIAPIIKGKKKSFQC